MAYNYQQYPYQYGQNIPQTPIQNNGLILVRSEAEARNYPVAYGNSVTFKDETSPYVYTKTMGFSQLDRPVFEKFKLVKEELEEEAPQKNDCKCDSLKPQVEEMQEQINSLWKEINFLKERKKRREDNEQSNSNGKSV